MTQRVVGADDTLPVRQEDVANTISVSRESRRGGFRVRTVWLFI